MKLMRGYRFRREAFRLLQSFLLVFVAAFFVEAMADWARGRPIIMPLFALGLSACASASRACSSAVWMRFSLKVVMATAMSPISSLRPLPTISTPVSPVARRRRQSSDALKGLLMVKRASR